MNSKEYDLMYQHEQTLWWYQTLDALVEAFVAKKAEKNPQRIFDAGCGTGRLVKRFQKYGHTSGIDYAEEAVAYAQKYGITTVTKDDVNTWSGSPDSYDIIISLDVLCHSDVSDELKIVQSWYRALDAEGMLILNLPAFNCLLRHHDRLVLSKRRYCKKEVISLLEQAGFEIQLVAYRLPHVFILLWIKKIMEKLSRSQDIISDVRKIPAFFNMLLRISGSFDNTLIQRGIRAPFGSSVFVVAYKSKNKVNPLYDSISL